MPDLSSSFIDGYQPAILALIILTLIVLIQAFLGALFGFVKGDETPGVPAKGGHGDMGFRALRTYQNSVENLPAFAVALIVAIAAGAGASMVNGLAWAHVGLRVIYWTIYYTGVGKPAGGPRSLAYVLGWLANLVLGVVALFALLG